MARTSRRALTRSIDVGAPLRALARVLARAGATLIVARTRLERREAAFARGAGGVAGSLTAVVARSTAPRERNAGARARRADARATLVVRRASSADGITAAAVQALSERAAFVRACARAARDFAAQARRAVGAVAAVGGIAARVEEGRAARAFRAAGRAQATGLRGAAGHAQIGAADRAGAASRAAVEVATRFANAGARDAPPRVVAELPVAAVFVRRAPERAHAAARTVLAATGAALIGGSARLCRLATRLPATGALEANQIRPGAAVCVRGARFLFIAAVALTGATGKTLAALPVAIANLFAIAASAAAVGAV